MAKSLAYRKRIQDLEWKISNLAHSISKIDEKKKGNPNHDDKGRFATGPGFKDKEDLDVGQHAKPANLPAVVPPQKTEVSTKKDIDSFIREASQKQMDRRSFMRGLVSAAVNSSRVIHAASKALDSGPPDISIKLNSPEYIKYMSQGIGGKSYVPGIDHADIFRVADGGWLFTSYDKHMGLTMGAPGRKSFPSREAAVQAALDPEIPQEEVGFNLLSKPHASRKKEVEEWEKEWAKHLEDMKRIERDIKEWEDRKKDK